MPKKVAIIIVIFFVSLVFIEKKQKEQIMVDLQEGKVLGIVERRDINDDINFLSNTFPEAKDAFKFPRKMNDIEIDIDSTDIGLVMDLTTEEILYEKDSNRPVSIASITKLATALTFLDLETDLNSVHKVTGKDRINGGRIYIYSGDEILIRDLLHLSLIASANTATCALINSTDLTIVQFVDKMNEKMKNLGLSDTFFQDIVGLGNNTSTARDIAMLLKIALENDIISDIVAKSEYEFSTLSGRVRRVSSTNNLFETYPNNNIELLGGKTGFTNLAGYCFTGKFSRNGNFVVSVVLNSDTLNSRFTETEKMIDWVYDSYVW